MKNLFFIIFFLYSTFIFSEQSLNYCDNYACVKGFNHKYGIINCNGDIIADTIYDYIRIYNKFIIVEYKGKKYLHNPISKQALNPAYENITTFIYIDSLVAGTINNKIDIINEKNQIIFSIQADYIEDFSQNYLKFDYQNKYGLIGLDGRIKIKPDYDDIYNFSEEFNFLNLFKRRGGPPELFTDLDYSDNWIYNSSIFIVVKDKKHGICDSTGKEILKPTYSWIWDYAPNVLLVQKKKGWGLINSKGNELTKIDIQQIGNVFWNRFINKLFKKYIDIANTEREEDWYQYNFEKGLSEGMILFKKDGKRGFLDVNGNVKIKNKYNDARIFSEGLAAVQKKKKWGYIDINDSIVIPFVFSTALEFYNGYSVVKIGNSWNFIDKNGKSKFQEPYDSISRCINNVYIIQKDGKFGFTDLEDLHIEPSFEKVKPYNRFGYASVKLLNKWGIIDKKGNFVVDCQYDNYFIYYNNGFILTINNNEKYGLLDSNFKTIFPVKYDDIYFYLKDQIRVELNGENKYYDFLGNEIKTPKNCNSSYFINKCIVKCKGDGNEFYLMNREGKIIWQYQED